MAAQPEGSKTNTGGLIIPLMHPSPLVSRHVPRTALSAAVAYYHAGRAPGEQDPAARDAVPLCGASTWPYALSLALITPRDRSTISRRRCPRRAVPCRSRLQPRRAAQRRTRPRHRPQQHRSGHRGPLRGPRHPTRPWTPPKRRAAARARSRWTTTRTSRTPAPWTWSPRRDHVHISHRPITVRSRRRHHSTRQSPCARCAACRGRSHAYATMTRQCRTSGLFPLCPPPGHPRGTLIPLSVIRVNIPNRRGDIHLSATRDKRPRCARGMMPRRRPCLAGDDVLRLVTRGKRQGFSWRTTRRYSGR